MDLSDRTKLLFRYDATELSEGKNIGIQKIENKRKKKKILRRTTRLQNAFSSRSPRKTLTGPNPKSSYDESNCLPSHNHERNPEPRRAHIPREAQV